MLTKFSRCTKTPQRSSTSRLSVSANCIFDTRTRTSVARSVARLVQRFIQINFGSCPQVQRLRTVWLLGRATDKTVTNKRTDIQKSPSDSCFPSKQTFKGPVKQGPIPALKVHSSLTSWLLTLHAMHSLAKASAPIVPATKITVRRGSSVSSKGGSPALSCRPKS